MTVSVRGRSPNPYWVGWTTVTGVYGRTLDLLSKELDVDDDGGNRWTYILDPRTPNLTG